jgi:hypothetical protein
MRLLSFIIVLSFILVGCNQKDAKRDAEKDKQRAAARAKQEKIDKAKKQLAMDIKEKKDIFEKTKIAEIKTKDGKKVFKDCEIYEWTPSKLTLYSKDGSLDTVHFSDLDEATREELGFDKKLYSTHKSYLAYVKRNTFTGGTASVAVNRKKTDADLRKDAEAATTEHRIRYTYFKCSSMGNDDYKINLYLLKVSSTGVGRIQGVFNGTVNGRIWQLGTNKPQSNTRKFARTQSGYVDARKEVTLYGGEGKYFKSRAAAVESRYEALKFRNK